MEAMEDDSSEVKDDHNHNHRRSSGDGKATPALSSQVPGGMGVSQPVCSVAPGGEPAMKRGEPWSPSPCGSKFMDSDSGSDSSEVSETECSAANSEEKFSLDSTSKFLLNAMAIEDYRKNHWPNLEEAIDRLLIQNLSDHISVSYAQIYGYVYKCVCQQHSELLYGDLTSKITAHLQQVSTQLQASPPQSLIENFNVALTQYLASLQCIVPVFIYLLCSLKLTPCPFKFNHPRWPVWLKASTAYVQSGPSSLRPSSPASYRRSTLLLLNLGCPITQTMTGSCRWSSP
ncbi:PREDICTED: CDK2-associated and cullin domain-containing protein 1-like isoform X2 [Cyprinodon variegatus]|uniref:CDK2-associated and cullin domain-containing protein 1-like isoform X2 n=1 Tax=Cyprinodon variegatus TaxID=28743 RepID=UPI00074275C1|nr:PREDICTED: CDK2-associated and cullin domain-containing protein 1-like isoform X2 [Cyprinodon variegatus]